MICQVTRPPSNLFTATVTAACEKNALDSGAFSQASGAAATPHVGIRNFLQMPSSHKDVASLVEMHSSTGSFPIGTSRYENKKEVGVPPPSTLLHTYTVHKTADLIAINPAD